MLAKWRPTDKIWGPNKFSVNMFRLPESSCKALEVTLGPGSSQYLALFLLGFRKGTAAWKCSVSSLCFKLGFDPR